MILPCSFSNCRNGNQLLENSPDPVVNNDESKQVPCMPLSLTTSIGRQPPTSKEPNPQKYHKHQTQKYHKRKPSHPLSLRHSLHSSHRSIQVHSRIRKILILQSALDRNGWRRVAIVSISPEESRISSPIFTVTYLRYQHHTSRLSRGYILEHADFLEESFYHVVVL
jgi:hypothetical protein